MFPLLLRAPLRALLRALWPLAFGLFMASALAAPDIAPRAVAPDAVSYTHLTLPTTPYV